MFTVLLRQQWLKTIRTKGFYKNLVIEILMGIMALYFVAAFIITGILLSKVVTLPDLTGAALYIILGCLAVRFFIQQLNTINVQHYQTLPLRRAKLVNFLLLKPLASPYNYLTFILLIPMVAPNIDGLATLRFTIGCVFIIWFNALLASYLKRRFASAILMGLAVLLVPMLFGVLEYFKLFSLFGVSQFIFNPISGSWLGTLLLLALPMSMLALNKLYFSKNYYTERFEKKEKMKHVAIGEVALLNRFGTVGDFMALLLKLILRHKRTKSMLYIGALFLLYGLLFYTNKLYADSYGMQFFCAVILSGMWMFMFGQWVIGWDSSYFDALMTKNFPVRTYILANYYMLLAFCIVSFILTTPYFFLGSKIIMLQCSAFLFNIGVNLPLLLYFSTYNTKRIDLKNASAFNYQGTTFKNFLIIIPLMFLPMLLMGVLTRFVAPNHILWAIGAVGVVGVLLQKPIIGACVRQFNRRKYALAEGFRHSE